MRFLLLASAALSGLACAAPSPAFALELIGQAGILGEWELTANLEAAAGRQEFAGPKTRLPPNWSTATDQR